MSGSQGRPPPAGDEHDATDAERQDLLQRDVFLAVAAGLSLLNGMHFSPFFDPALVLLRPLAAGFFVTSPLVLLYITSLFISLCTLILGGVPAAIYERMRGQEKSSPGSLGLWAAGVAVMAAPTLLGLGGLM